MEKNPTVLQIIDQSRDLVFGAILKKGTSYQRTIPIYSEIFDLFVNILRETGDKKISEIPELPEKLSDAEIGIYKKGDELIVFYEIPLGLLKYIAMYSSNHFGGSSIAKTKSGIYIAVLKLCSKNPLVYSPDLFTYFYTPTGDKNETYSKKILPILALDHDLKPEFSNVWVYLAIRQLSQKYFNDLQYLFLLEDSSQEELEFLKKCGFLE